MTFPTLMLLGVPAIESSATSTVALIPGVASSYWGYRRQVASHRHWLRLLVLPCLAGGFLGSVLLLRTSESSFGNFAPYLILFATLLFFAQEVASRHKSGNRPVALSRKRITIAALLLFGVAVYGGYFGAGIGILTLALLGYLGLTDIHAMNGLKNFAAICINFVAAIWFIVHGRVDWPRALLLATGAIVGGYTGARFAQYIGREKARAAVIVIGIAATLILLLERGKL